MDRAEDREREQELLKRILQYDIQDAIARYEAEMGVSVSEIRVMIGEAGECTMQVEAKPGAPHAEVPMPVPRMLVLTIGR